MESGLPVQTGKRLINVRTTPDGVTVQFEDGSLANGDLLIGTDGIHSRIRTFIDAQAPIPKLVGLIGVALGALLTFKEPHLHHAEGRTSLKSHLLAISQTLFQPGKTLRIVTVLLATSLLLSVIFEFGPLWQLALAAPVGLYGLANAAVLSAGGVGSWLSVRRMLSKPATIVGVAGLLMVSSPPLCSSR